MRECSKLIGQKIAFFSMFGRRLGKTANRDESDEHAVACPHSVWQVFLGLNYLLAHNAHLAPT